MPEKPKHHEPKPQPAPAKQDDGETVPEVPPSGDDGDKGNGGEQG